MKYNLILIAILSAGCNVTLPKLPDIKPPVTVTTTTTTSTTTTTTLPPVASVYGNKIDCPAWAKGGECPTPAGLDIRYDVACDGDYTFAGDLLAPYTKITRNADGTYRCELPDVVKNGVVFHAFAYNFPSSASDKVKTNVCERYDKSGTFRFWIQCYEVQK